MLAQRRRAQLHRQRGDDSGRPLRRGGSAAPRSEAEPVHQDDQPGRPHRGAGADRQSQPHRAAGSASRPRRAPGNRELHRPSAGGDQGSRRECARRRIHHRHGRLESRAVRRKAPAYARRARRRRFQSSRDRISGFHRPGRDQLSRPRVFHFQGSRGQRHRRDRGQRSVARRLERAARGRRPSRIRSAAPRTRWPTPPASVSPPAWIWALSSSRARPISRAPSPSTASPARIPSRCTMRIWRCTAKAR